MVRPHTTDPQISGPKPGAAVGAEMAQMHQWLTCGLQAWSAYWSACFGARDFADLYRANTTLAAEALTLAGNAAAERQRVDGRVTPTLSDA